MISVNISTIKQYFWYYDNFNKKNILGGQSILPILKIKDKYYVFNNKYTKMFDEFVLRSFVTYDKQYSYLAISDEISETEIKEKFSTYSCIFIHVDETLRWSVIKNSIFDGNVFYDEMTSDLNTVLFQPCIKKRISSEKISHMLHPSDESIHSLIALVRTPSPPSDQVYDVSHVDQSYVETQTQLYNKVMGDEVEVHSGVEIPFFENEFVFVEVNHADL